MQKMIELDDFDRRLIELVRQNNLEPARSLADKVGLSISAVLRRLRRLRAEGAIVADIAVVNPVLTGSDLTMHVLVRMKEPGRRAMDAFARKIALQPEVTGAWEVTGDDDFVLKIEIGSMAEYADFTRSMLDEEEGVLSFKTLITIRPIIQETHSRRPLRSG
jgi:DNA-binding Lrp family transcriptional regulator